MGARTIQYSGELVVRTCWCGIHHALPLDLDRQIDNGAQKGYCPLGHTYIRTPGKSDLALEREHTARLTSRLDQVTADRDQTKRSLAAQKGVTTRIRRRAENGVCPHCNRSFANVVAHMQSEHPECLGDHS